MRSAAQFANVLEARWTRFAGQGSSRVATVALALFFGCEAARGLAGANLHVTDPVILAARALSIMTVGNVTAAQAPALICALDALLAVGLLACAGWRLTGLLGLCRTFIALAPVLMLRDELFAGFPWRPNGSGCGALATSLVAFLACNQAAGARWATLKTDPRQAELLAESEAQRELRQSRWRRLGIVAIPLALTTLILAPKVWPRYLIWFHARQESAALSEVLQGKLIKKSMPPSEILHGVKITTWVYLPPGYESGNQRYPVVYVMHGMPGEVRDCFVKGRVQDAAEALILDHKIAPLILVGWDGEGPGGPADITNYLDRPDYKMESFMVNELVPYVDSTYRTIPDKRYRALDGISAGGYAAPNLMFKHPDIWTVGASHNGFFSPDDDEENMVAILGPRRSHGALWDSNDPTKTVLEIKPTSGLHLYLDIGAGDELQPEFSRFAEQVRQQGLDVEAHIFPGRHTWTFWSRHFYDSLRFANLCFARATADGGPVQTVPE